MAEGGMGSGGGPDSPIIAGVIDGVKQSFIDSGVDLEVLAKLRELWISKLRSSTRHGAMAEELEPGTDKKRKHGGKIAAEKDLDIKVVPKIKAELEEFDFNSDDISIVTDSDNEDRVGPKVPP